MGVLAFFFNQSSKSFNKFITKLMTINNMARQEVELCERCERLPGDVACSCENHYCEDCFTLKHLPRHQNHRRGGTGKTEKIWSWVSGTASTYSDKVRRVLHQNDETAKWFGLYIQKFENNRVTRLVETNRFWNLIEKSSDHTKHNARRQYPSITSFIGETGAGKSTLIRYLIYNSAGSQDLEDLEAPVPGEQAGESRVRATTGEVNLYLDPSTAGTSAPHFFADCEGMLGGEPDAARHQKEWFNHGRRYLMQSKDGKPIDRKTAVMTVYPRFLYIFSDVICLVTRNQRAWAHSAAKLLEWSQVGAHHTVNQSALPALIIVLNGPSIENEAWISEDCNVATRDFFQAVEKEISENNDLSKMAKKHGDKTMRDLLLRNFSSVYVHYVPLKGFEHLGNSRIIISQVERLARRVQEDSTRVRKERANTFTLFDAKQLSTLFDYAFKHIASGSDEPFDFNQSREQISLPTTVESHFAEFLSRSLHNCIDENFDVAASTLGSCIIRNWLKLARSGPLRPSVIFDKKTRDICGRALEQFLGNSMPCSYVHIKTNEKCINVKTGHAKGHQAAGGSFLAEGSFINGIFDTERFSTLVGKNIVDTIREINEKVDGETKQIREYAAELHRSRLRSFVNQSFWKTSFSPTWVDAFNEQFGDISGAHLTTRSSVCYACLFGRPEYTLPCRHVICCDCLREFDQSSPEERYPGVAVHKNCVLCESRDEKEWPYRADYRPDLGGIRVLALDGGGVRGIIQVTVLRRLERLVNLDMPFGELFDLIVGTSAGGLNAMGLGIHNFSVEECAQHFKLLCQEGFQPRLFTKTPIIGWFARMFTSSIYQTEPLENALRRVFGQKQLFGHSGNASRVAVTTTVSSQNSECRLLANYNWGDDKKYLNSNISTWFAGRCTSAAPMYFEAAFHDGFLCRDGGLKENNPMRLAVKEAKVIWGSESMFDTVLSIGCGKTDIAQNVLPTGSLYQWLSVLFAAWLRSMDEDLAWTTFSTSTDNHPRLRCSRLDVDLSRAGKNRFTTGPALDDVKSVDRMEESAETCPFHCQLPEGDFSPVHYSSSIVAPPPINHDELQTLALRHMASLYFFEMTSFTDGGDVSIIKGWICCRVGPQRAAYSQLLGKTCHLQVKGQTVELPQLQDGKRLMLEISIQQPVSNDEGSIRIDVKFKNHAYLVAISGFPTTLKKLKAHWQKSL